jgi:methyl-accepting chemotaxis protein
MSAILTLNQYPTNKIRVLNHLELEITKVKADTLTLRRNEKDFLARNDTKYQKKFEGNVQNLQKDISSLSAAVETAGLDSSSVKNFASKLLNYKDRFSEIVEIQKKIGLSPKDGLRGALRAVVHQAEAEINRISDETLRADMLQLRRSEKDFILRLDAKYLDRFNKDMDVFVSNLNSSTHSGEDKDKIRTTMDDYQGNFNAFASSLQRKGLNSGSGLMGEMRKSVHETEEILRHLSQQLNIIVQQEIGSVDKVILFSNMVCIALILLTIGTIVWLGFQILRPIQKLSTIMVDTVEENDLTLRIVVGKRDEIGTAGEALNGMLDSFQEIIDQSNQAAGTIAASAEEMSAITNVANEGIQNQRMQTEELALVMVQMTVTIQQVADQALSAASAANDANTECNRGQKVVDDAARTIRTLSETIQNASTAIQKVEDDSEKIGAVLDVIRSIAEQTNLLALNAAIEAARAGEQGRGFAVVADEVRTLAGRTQNSIQEIQKMIESLQGSSRDAVKQMDESSSQMLSSVEQTTTAGDALKSIVETVVKIENMNDQISSAAEEQSQGVKSINANVVNINEVAVQSAEGADQTAQSSNELAKLAATLQSTASQFKV